MEIIEGEKLLLTGIPVQAEWQDLWSAMPKAWAEIFEREPTIEDFKPRRFVDASLQVKNGVYLQLVAAEVDQLHGVPERMVGVEIPAQRYLYYRHTGSLMEIPKSFGAMYEWAGARGHKAGDFKLDAGYTKSGEETFHDLYVTLEPAKEWRFIKRD